MAQVSGKDSTKARDLVITTYKNAVTKDNKGIYLDVELDVRDERTGPQTNPHLITTKTSVDGKKRDGSEGVDYAHGRSYSMAQFNAIREVADHQTIVSPEGVEREVYTVKADIFPPFKGEFPKGADGKTMKDANGKSIENAKVTERTNPDGTSSKTTDKGGKRVTEMQTPDGLKSIETSGMIINTKTLQAPTFEVDKNIVERQFEATVAAREARDKALAEKAAPAPEAAAPEAAPAEVSFDGANDRKVEEPAAEAPVASGLDAKLAGLEEAMQANQGRENEGPEMGA